MAKFRGAIGFAHTVRAAGVTKEVITEKVTSGETVRLSRQSSPAEDTVNDDISFATTVSVVANGYVKENLFAIRYVRMMGENWKVVSATPEYPRLILQLGGPWNGGTPSTADSP